jgi:hypothetical protein
LQYFRNGATRVAEAGDQIESKIEKSKSKIKNPGGNVKEPAAEGASPTFNFRPHLFLPNLRLLTSRTRRFLVNATKMAPRRWRLLRKLEGKS